LENPFYANLVISEDATFTTISLKTNSHSSEEGNKDGYLTDAENSEVVWAVKEIVKQYEAEDFQIRIAGSPVVTDTLKRWMLRDMRKFMILAVVMIVFSLFLMFREVSGVILPLLVVLLTLLSTVGLMAATGTPIKLPTQILPSFLMAVGIGAAVHILAMFFHHLRTSGDKEESIVYAVGHSGLAVVMASLTTAGGLLSFSTADVAPIADLGIFGCLGILLSLLYTIVLLPPLLALMPVNTSRIKEHGHKKTSMDKTMDAVGNFAINHAKAILIFTAITIVLSLIGASRIRFSHNVLKWFPESNETRQASQMIDKELRGSVTFEAVIDAGEENGLYEPELLKRIEESANYLETLSDGNVFVGKTVALTSVLKEINKALNENRQEFYTVPQDRKLIAQEFLLFEMSGSDDLEDLVDSQFSKTRLTMKLPFTDAVAYGPTVEKIEEHFESRYPGVEITLTGMVAILSKTIFNVIISMAKSYVTAFIVVSILMVLLIGRLQIGLLSMIPNLFPILLTLGVVGWFNIPMTLFTMLVGSIAIGLAVDDTIHFMHNFRRYHDENGGNTEKAIMDTLYTSGRAMLVTSIVLSAGFFIFMFAGMNNLFDFGLLTGLTIIVALLSDYFISPALLYVYEQFRTRK
ncbi:MAG: MMPL family transporter, partial [bacterium]|nr:MMPL family transporter [bacterium]